MERINLPFFYQVGAQLNPLTKFTATTENRVNIWLASFSAHTYVYTLLVSFSMLTVCRTAGVELTKAIVNMQDWMNKTEPDKWGEIDPSADVLFSNVVNKAKEFETVLSAELQTLATYYVTQKGIYDTTALIQQTEQTLPTPVLNKIDEEVKEEIRESGKCLAFDCATASGFHIIRATERVLHEYYLHVCNPKTKNKLENWSAYISALHKLSEIPTVDKAVRYDVKKVEALLRQIKDQDRNLIMHPEVLLSSDEAFTLFEIAKGAIIAMANKLPAGKKK